MISHTFNLTELKLIHGRKKKDPKFKKQKATQNQTKESYRNLFKLAHEGDEERVGGLGPLLLRDLQPLLHGV